MGSRSPSNLFMLCASTADHLPAGLIKLFSRTTREVVGSPGPGTRARSTAIFAFNLSRPLLDAADAKSDGAAYAAAAINILDGPTVNHHRLREHAGVFTDYVTLIIYEGTPFIELILQRSCTYSGPTSNGIGPLVQHRAIRR